MLAQQGEQFLSLRTKRNCTTSLDGKDCMSPQGPPRGAREARWVFSLTPWKGTEHVVCVSGRPHTPLTVEETASGHPNLYFLLPGPKIRLHVQASLVGKCSHVTESFPGE